MVHILEDVLYHSLPGMSPTNPVRTRGSAMSWQLPSCETRACVRVFLHNPPTTSGASRIKPLPKIANGFAYARASSQRSRRPPSSFLYLPLETHVLWGISYLSRSQRSPTEAIRWLSLGTYCTMLSITSTWLWQFVGCRRRICMTSKLTTVETHMFSHIVILEEQHRGRKLVSDHRRRAH